MGTALTEAQLRELNRLTKRLFLCFDADAAGQDATLRGMELAVAQGFDVQVVALPKGTDPADDPAAFERQLASARELSGAPRAALHERAPDKQRRVRGDRDVPRALPDSPERQDARRLAADLLDLPPETQAALAPRTRIERRGRRLAAPARRGAAARAERARRRRRAPELAAASSRSSGRSTSTTSCTGARARTCSGRRRADGELTPLLAELYALGDERGDHDRDGQAAAARACASAGSQRELADADGERLLELQQALAKSATRSASFA